MDEPTWRGPRKGALRVRRVAAARQLFPTNATASVSAQDNVSLSPSSLSTPPKSNAAQRPKIPHKTRKAQAATVCAAPYQGMLLAKCQRLLSRRRLKRASRPFTHRQSRRNAAEKRCREAQALRDGKQRLGCQVCKRRQLGRAGPAHPCHRLQNTAQLRARRLGSNFLLQGLALSQGSHRRVADRQRRRESALQDLDTSVSIEKGQNCAESTQRSQHVRRRDACLLGEDA